MKIALLTRHDPKEIRVWSGTMFHLYHKLKEKHEVEVIGTRLLKQIGLFGLGNFPPDFFISDGRYSECSGRLISERINRLGCDLIFFGDLLFIPTDVGIPLVHLSDLTYEQVITHIVEPDERNIKCCKNLEELLLNSSYRIIYASEWIKSRAVAVHNINPGKMEVIEFGANIPTPKSYSIDINMDVCNLLFVGKNWLKKGGDKVLGAYEVLKREGFPCTLTIVGSAPDRELKEDKDLTIIPRLDKSREEELERLCEILYKSHFMVLPTVFDAFGIVFCEASAYAVPSIATNVGGVGQAIREGKNGFLMPPDATAEDYAAKIRTVFCDKDSYIKLRQSSRKEYETRLNWDVWGERVNKILEETLSEWKSQKKRKEKKRKEKIR